MPLTGISGIWYDSDAQAVAWDELLRNRLFTLSDYGFYLFLFKLSLHLTRIREGVSRN